MGSLDLQLCLRLALTSSAVSSLSDDDQSCFWQTGEGRAETLPGGHHSSGVINNLPRPPTHSFSQTTINLQIILKHHARAGG